MQRIAFQLTLREGAEAAYDASHKAVWPEMLELLTQAGIREYSIFRRDRLLVLYMHVEDFEKSWSIVESDPVNTRWQAAMAPYFEPATGLLSGERFRMMREVFYLA